MFFRRRDGRIYIKAQNTTVLKEVMEKIDATLWSRLGIEHDEIKRINCDVSSKCFPNNEFWRDDLRCDWKNLRDFIDKIAVRDDILIIIDYVYYDERVYGDCVKVYFSCGGRVILQNYYTDQREFDVYHKTRINNPKEWIDFIGFDLSRQNTIILANLGITGLKRGVNPVNFVEIKDELRSFLIMMLPFMINFVGIRNMDSFIGYVFMFIGVYLTYYLKSKMKFKIMFLINLIISILCIFFCVVSIFYQLLLLVP